MTAYQTPHLSAANFQSALQAYKNAVIDYEAVCPDDNEERYQAEVDRLVDIATACAAHLMQHQAPDLEGVFAKLEIAMSEPSAINAAYVHSAMCDLARLGKIEASPAFVPMQWANQFERAGGNIETLPTGETMLGVAVGNKRAANMVRNLNALQSASLTPYLDTLFKGRNA